MTNWILTSSVLIAAVICIRALLGSRITMRLRYALWALVLLRLLIPGNFIPSELSLEKLTLAFEKQPQVQALTQELNAPQQSYEEIYQEVAKEHYEVYYPQNATVPDVLPESFTAALPAQEQLQIRQEVELRLDQSTPIYSLTQILLGIWILGMAVIGTFLLAINWNFSRRLKRTRQRIEADTPVPVYKSFMAETPCLFGLFRPVIYITQETAADSRALPHILAHESSHYYHKDHLWAFLRCLCLVLHWYNPLVWLAVSLSRQDCELACDEATIARIGEENRLEYGKTLVDMTCIKRAPAAALLTATTMLSDKKTLTQRIRQVANRPRVLISAIVAVAVIAAVAVGCTFTGAPEKPADPTEPTETTAPTETTEPAEPTIDGNAHPAEKYRVGTDIPANTYVFIPESAENPGYFRLEDGVHTVSETFKEFFIWSPRSGVTIELRDCYFLPADQFTAPVKEDGSYGPGMYRIGTDIPEGNYVITPLYRDVPALWKLFFSIEQPSYHNEGYCQSATGTRSISLEAPRNPYEAIFLQDCTLTPVVSETFTIPGAPTAAEVQPRPPYDGALVAPYWEQGVDIVGHGTYFISIPMIWPFSQDAIDCQAEIYADLLPTLKYYEETAGYTDIYDVRLLPISEKASYQTPRGISYSSYLYKDMLSIVTGTLRMDDMTQYFAYTLDLSTGKRMNNEDILKRLDLSSINLKEALTAAYIQLYGSSTGSQLEKTISKENLNDVRLYVTGEGAVMAAARIYSIAGADSYMHLIPVYTPPAPSGRAAIRTLHADWNYQPAATPEATARSLVEHFQGAGQILLAESDYFMTQANITEDFINSDMGRKYELTAEYLQNHFRCVNVLYQQDNTAIYVAKITLMQDEENGLWYPWDMLTPYSTGAYPEKDARLATYTALFDSTTGNGRIRQMALTSFYANPSFVDLPAMFYNDLSRGQLTDAERAFLADQGFDLHMDVQSHTAAEINNALQVAFGISLNQTLRIGLNALTYHEGTDSYYSNHGDTNFPDITITRYTDKGGGMVDLYYTAVNSYVPGYDKDEFVAKILLRSDGSFTILSNSLIGKPNEMPDVFPEAPQSDLIQPLPTNPVVSDLVKPYWAQGINFAGSDTYYITIPQIYPFSQEAIDVNREIYDLFAKELKDQVNYMVDDYEYFARFFDITGADPSVGQNQSGVFYYGYTASYQNGILSIVVILDSTASGRETYHTYNLNVSSGQDGTKETILSDDEIRSALEAAYKEMHANVDSSLDFYHENLKKTLSDDNVRKCTVSNTEDGTLQLVGWIYTIGSVEKVQKLISLNTSQILELLNIKEADVLQLLEMYYIDTYRDSPENARKQGLQKTTSLENLHSGILVKKNDYLRLYITIYPPDGSKPYSIYLGVDHLRR